ncbi:hypothetical protein [Chengkuizengella axinellae]|uniref:Uncharacterized protein n=1 Tax=Chengkuizengella axinellae TaxID=3064388 RepID=A0ABT9J0W6_9BACL|nr:hypothetical protein [Chengkuizengella sp. 2205SS18-9]MDP5275259.1 hypothetical protein [Chengkuizengella sp. 2205SS18-9]
MATENNLITADETGKITINHPEIIDFIKGVSMNSNLDNVMNTEGHVIKPEDLISAGVINNNFC